MSLWEDQGFIHCECHANHEAYPFRWWLIIPTIDIESIFNKLNIIPLDGGPLDHGHPGTPSKMQTNIWIQSHRIQSLTQWITYYY